MLKNRIFNYIIIEFLKNYATLLFIFSLIIWLTQAVRLLNLVYDDGNSFYIYIQYVIFQLPKIISKLSVIIFFITIFWTLSILEETNEIKTISFSGIEPKKIFFKFVKFSIFFVLILIFFKALIVPYFSKKARDLLLDDGIGSFSSIIRENNFNNPARNITIYVEKKNQIGEFQNIIIFQEDMEKKNKVIIAKNGVVTKIRDENYFVVEKGVIQEQNPNSNPSQTTFTKTTIDIKNFKKKSADYYKFNEITFFGLLELYLQAKDKAKNGPLSEILGMIITPLILPSLVLIVGSLFSNQELKIKQKNLKFFLFLIGFALIFTLELLIAYSQKNIFFSFVSIAYVFFVFFLSLFISNITTK